VVENIPFFPNSYYEGALKTNVPQTELRADLAELYLKLHE
jgi:hypothetical protein